MMHGKEGAKLPDSPLSLSLPLSPSPLPLLSFLITPIMEQTSGLWLWT